MKEKINLGIVEETLLIPLYMRAKESQRADAIIKDTMAVEIVSKIDYDFQKFDKSNLSELGCVVRSNYFDNKIRAFVNKEKNAIVVNVGCGLDTRYQRIIEKENAIFYEVDFPDVINLRKKLIPNNSNDINIASSMLDIKWMVDLKSKHPNCRFIFIIEGVLMYLEEGQIKSFLNNLAIRFKGSAVYFDVCGSMFNRVKNDSVKHTQAQFASAINSGKTITKWIPNMIMTDDIDYFDLNKSRWGIFGFIMRLIPIVSRRFSRIFGFVIK